jgi:hypothetical protein
MSFGHLAVAHANHFQGTAADATREEITTSAKICDNQRYLWGHAILPMFTEKELDLIYANKARARTWQFANLDQLARWSDAYEWSTLTHLMIHQDFVHVASASVPVRHVPWQLRIEFAAPVRDILVKELRESVEKDIKDFFLKAGWEFTVTDCGFLLAQKFMLQELRDIVDCYTAFMHSRETPLEEGERSDLIQALVDKSAADIAANAEKAASKVKGS